MKLSLAPILAASAATGMLAACGGASDSAAPEMFSVARGGGGIGPLAGYDGGSGRVSFRLPPGIASADGRLFYVARAGLTSTNLQRYDRRTGELVGQRRIKGGWTLAGVSATGRFVVLGAPGSERSKLLLLDNESTRTRLVTLPGRYDAEAVSPDGRAIFIEQWHGPSRYSVRYYDLDRSRLQTATLRMKGQVEEPVMTGSPAGSVATRDGRWLLTLYLNTSLGKAFVHALNLAERRAVCIDLPGEGSSLKTLASYALAASPDGSRVYAANPSLGLIADVDVERYAVRSVAQMPVSRGVPAASALSKAGRVLYVAAGSRLWAYDTAFLRLRGPYDAHGRVTGLAFSRDGTALYAVRGDGRALSFGAANGQELDA